MNSRTVPLLLLCVGCTEQGFSQLTKVDTFRQERKNTVDVVLVIDNSCSMVEEQDKLASNFDKFIQYFDDADVDWQLGVITTDVEDANRGQGALLGGDDEIVILDESGSEVDRVGYTAEWAVAPGVAMALDPSWFNGVSNESFERWCAAGAGTPGTMNESCGITEGSGMDDRYGELLVTEFLADPDAVSDELGEWVELTNVSAETLDLTGWSLADNGRNTWAFPDGASVDPGASIVVARSTDTATNGGLTADFATGAEFSLNNNVLLLSDETEGGAEIFSEMVAQGTSGSGLEQGLEAVHLALSPEQLAGRNAGLIREDANLTILVVSDEEDSSPWSVDYYLRYFASIKGDAAFRDHSIMNVSAVVGSDAPELGAEISCVSSNGQAYYGKRYVDAVQQTGGLVDSICDEDFSPIVSQLGLTLSGLVAEFALSGYPDLDTLKVSIYESDTLESKVKDLTLDTDYSYVEERNAILFEYEQVPESEQYILAEYKVRSGQ